MVTTVMHANGKPVPRTTSLPTENSNEAALAKQWAAKRASITKVPGPERMDAIVKTIKPEDALKLMQERERRLEEEQRQEHESRVRQMLADLRENLGTRFINCTLDNFEIYDDRQKPVIERLRQLADQLPQLVKRGRSFVFAGAAGTGKDHLAAAMARHAIKQHLIEVRQINARALSIASFDAAEKLIKEMARPRILIISDPSSSTGVAQDRLHELIDQRYKFRRPTWLTVNAHGSADLINTYGMAVTGRLLQDAERFACEWPEFRMKNVNRPPG